MDLFKASIPGESLTKAPGAATYEMPPQFPDVNDALEYLFDKLTEKRQATRLVLMMKKGMSAEYIARTILFEGFNKGKWSPDSALLMLKILVAMLVSIAVQKGVKPTIFNRDTEQEKFLSQFLDMDTASTPEATENTPSLPEFSGVLGGEL